MLIKVLDIRLDKIWEWKLIYFKLGMNTKTEGFLLFVSILVWIDKYRVFHKQWVHMKRAFGKFHKFSMKWPQV